MEIITLQEHNSQWLSTFLMEKELITETIKKYIHDIHHVGSTAVSDLLSKPIIDISVESVIYPPSQEIINSLATIGYQCKGDGGITGRIWFIKGQPRIFNLHFCSIHSQIVQNQIKFRDCLMENAQYRREYEQIKLKNYKAKSIDSTEYALAKSDFINKVISFE